MVTVLGNSSSQRNSANRSSARHGKSKRRVFRGRSNSGHKSENIKGNDDENAPRFSNVDTSSRFSTKVHRRSRSGKNRSVVSKSKFRRSRAPHRAAFSPKHSENTQSSNRDKSNNTQETRSSAADHEETDKMKAGRPSETFIPLFGKMEFSYFSQAPENVIFGRKKASSCSTPIHHKSKKNPLFRVSHHESMFSMSPTSMIFQG